MTPDQINAIAREYAKENGNDTAIFIGVRTVLCWLSERYTIMEKSKPKKKNNYE